MIVGVAGLILAAGLYWLWTPDKPRAVLEGRYLEPGCRYLEVADIRLHLCDSGPRDAPALILLHGFGASLQTWDAWTRLLQTDHRVIRFDLPGSGLTGPDPTNDYSDARSVAILATLMDKLGIARAGIVGNSIGGRIAWKFAGVQPSRVASLVLISPDGFASPIFSKTANRPIGDDLPDKEGHRAHSVREYPYKCSNKTDQALVSQPC